MYVLQEAYIIQGDADKIEENVLMVTNAKMECPPAFQNCFFLEGGGGDIPSYIFHIGKSFHISTELQICIQFGHLYSVFLCLAISYCQTISK